MGGGCGGRAGGGGVKGARREKNAAASRISAAGRVGGHGGDGGGGGGSGCGGGCGWREVAEVRLCCVVAAAPCMLAAGAGSAVGASTKTAATKTVDTMPMPTAKHIVPTTSIPALNLASSVPRSRGVAGDGSPSPCWSVARASSSSSAGESPVNPLRPRRGGPPWARRPLVGAMRS